MPWQARLDAPGTLHHTMLRGSERTTIFPDDTERDDFVARLAAHPKASDLARALGHTRGNISTAARRGATHAARW